MPPRAPGRDPLALLRELLLPADLGGAPRALARPAHALRAADVRVRLLLSALLPLLPARARHRAALLPRRRADNPRRAHVRRGVLDHEPARGWCAGLLSQRAYRGDLA